MLIWKQTQKISTLVAFVPPSHPDYVLNIISLPPTLVSAKVLYMEKTVES